jgi:hypothetical protein
VTISNIAIDGIEAATLANQNDPINFTQDRRENDTITPHPYRFETAIQADTSFVVIKNVTMKNLRSTAVKSLNSSRIHLQNTLIRASLAGVDAVDSFALSMAGLLDIQGPGGSGAEDEPPLYSQVSSFGIKTTRTVFKTISSGAEFATLLISGVRTGLWINQATVDLAQKSNITVQSVHTGLKLNDNAHWEWNPGLMQMPSSGPILQPKLELIKCAYTCVALDNSKFTLETEISDRRTAQAANKIRPRLTLRGVARQSDLQDEAARNQEELTVEFLHMGIIKADRSSSIRVSFWENIWCDYPNYSNISNNESTAALFLSEHSNLIYKKTEFSSENGCIKSGTMTSKLLRDGSSDKLDPVINMGPNANISIQRYASSSIGSQGTLVNQLETHVLDLFSVPLLLSSPYTSSTAGGDPLRIFVDGLKSVASVTIGETPAAIAKFDTENQELWIIPPPNNPSTSATDHALITLQGEAKSLAEPGTITLSRKGIEYQALCPNNYFEVPANTDLGTSKFCVMTFEAKNLNGQTYSSHQGSPIVNIPRDGTNGAIVRCNSISQYHSLISNIQWQAIAHHIASDSYNQWDYDAVGTAIPIGHSDNNPSSPQAASDISGQGAECINTGNNDLVTNSTRLPPPDGICDLGRSAEPQARYFDRDRTDLWDLAGNAAEWVADDYTHR